MNGSLTIRRQLLNCGFGNHRKLITGAFALLAYGLVIVLSCAHAMAQEVNPWPSITDMDQNQVRAEMNALFPPEYIGLGQLPKAKITQGWKVQLSDQVRYIIATTDDGGVMAFGVRPGEREQTRIWVSEVKSEGKKYNLPFHAFFGAMTVQELGIAVSAESTSFIKRSLEAPNDTALIERYKKDVLANPGYRTAISALLARSEQLKLSADLQAKLSRL